MRKSNKSYFSGTVAVLIVLASFVFSWKLLVPKYTENKQTSASLDAQISGSSKKLESLRRNQTTLVQLGDVPKQLAIAVPEDKDMPNLLTELEAVAAKYNIILPSVAISDGGGSAPVGTPASAASAGATSGNTVNISFAVSGGFDDITGFVGALEKDVRFMNIKSISLSSAQDTKGGSSLTLALQIEAYKRAAISASSSVAGGSE